MLIRGILVATSIVILTGCSKNNNKTGAEDKSSLNASEPEISVASKKLSFKDYIKCGIAADYLEDGILKDAITFKAARDNINPENASDTMKISEDFTNELAPNGSSSDPESVLKKAAKWRNSNTCQTFIKEFSSFLDNSINTYGKSLLASGEAQDTCAAFTDQYGLMELSMPKETKLKFEAGLQATLKDVYKSIKPYQAQYLTENDNGAYALNQYCTANPSSNLKSAISGVVAITAIESPRTIEIKSIRESTNNDRNYDGCINQNASRYQQKICSNHLYKNALDTAYSKSQSCDLDASDPQCIDEPNQFIQQFMYPLVLTELGVIKTEIEAVIANPLTDVNAADRIDKLSEPCEQNLIDQGIYGDDFSKKSKQICYKQGEKLFLEPYRQQLIEINKEINKYS